MTWGDAATLAIRGILRRIGRTILTVVAVALAAALLTGLLTIAHTARTRVLSQLSKGGPLASIRVTSAGGLDDRDVRQIEDLAGVRSVLPVMAVRELVVPPNPPSYSPPPSPSQPAAPTLPLPSRAFFETVVGADLARADQLPITLLAGRLPSPTSVTEVAVTKGYLQQVGLDQQNPGAALGTELELGSPRRFGIGNDEQIRGRWTRAVVVGVVAQDADDGDVLATIGFTKAADAFSDEGASLAVGSPVDPRYSALVVVADGLDAITPVRTRLEARGLATSASENLIESVQRYLNVVEIVLAGIGLIAVGIAAIGIANAMLAAVRERRREIGVLKAIGARDRDVMRMFLLEAFALGFVGGAIGVLAGWVLAQAVGRVVNGYLTSQGLAGVGIGAPLGILLGALAGATVLSIIAGTFPALRAARLPAREAVNIG